MESGYGLCSAVYPHVDSKASALAYAIQMSTYYNEKTKRVSVDLKKAKRIFQFFTDNVTLPDVKKDSTEELSELYSTLVNTLTSLAEQKPPSMVSGIVKN